MSDCNHNCSSCSSKCATHVGRNTEFIEPLNKFSSIKNVIGVMSGKGGVGKSMTTSMLAVHMQRLGYKVGVLDADITGPSIPKAFGIKQKAYQCEQGILPVESHNGIKVMSINALLDQEDAPVIWRGPVIAGVVKQFWTDVYWGELDYLFIDMPPGTGDVTLTVFQSIPVDGIVVVTSPQDLVSLIVKKAFNMAEKMFIPVLGIIENMSYVVCPDCNNKIYVYGESKIEKFAEELQTKVLGQMPLDGKLAMLCDEGMIEEFDNNYLHDAVELIKNIEREGASMKVAVATENGNVCEHFGKCGEFTVFTVEKGVVTERKTLNTTAHGHSALPPFLQENGVTVAICGGMGQGAYDAMSQIGIKVYIGASGPIEEAVNLLLSGKLGQGQANCSHHDHEEGHECGCNCGGGCH